ncbi:MAG: hypothetical protein ACFFG0_42245, partial [Candidatus Thorarchaeota archaeon]
TIRFISNIFNIVKDIVRTSWKHEELDRNDLTRIFYNAVTNILILVSKMVPRGTVYLLAEPEFLGVMPIRQDVNVIPADKPSRLRLGWVEYLN